MSRTTRLVFVAMAAVIAIGGLVIWSSRGESGNGARQSTAAADTSAETTSTRKTTGTSRPGRTDSAAAEQGPVLLRPGKVQKITVRKGAQVRFEARSPTDNEVHVHGFDISKEAPAGKTIAMSFPAKFEGIFEIEFELTGEQVADLEVRP